MQIARCGRYLFCEKLARDRGGLAVGRAEENLVSRLGYRIGECRRAREDQLFCRESLAEVYRRETGVLVTVFIHQNVVARERFVKRQDDLARGSPYLLGLVAAVGIIATYACRKSGRDKHRRQ